MVASGTLFVVVTLLLLFAAAVVERHRMNYLAHPRALPESAERDAVLRRWLLTGARITATIGIALCAFPYVWPQVQAWLQAIGV